MFLLDMIGKGYLGGIGEPAVLVWAGIAFL